MTEKKRVTCPETGHLEEVELERTPLGVVVTGCSRFRDGVPTCPRECARRMDRRDRIDVENRERVLLVLANLHDDAAQVATMLAEDLAADRMTVELAELGAHHTPPLADYDAVIIGARVRLGRHDRAVIDYIREHRGTLATLPAFFYSVGGHGVLDRDTYAHRMTRRTGWKPTATTSFADASPLQRGGVNAFARLVADETPFAIQPTLA